jgi:alkanesulfonate monooxygenase SsuD/methylene tetrahydromethanopterin reductase-like flavin-dependent oxidoreductase (luciferase family)
MDVDAFQERYALIENACSEIGRDFKEITFSWGCWFWIFEDEKERKRYVREIKRLEDYGDQFQAVMGTPEEILEKFEALKDAGATYFTLRFEDLPSKRGLQLCAEHIMKAI